MERIPTKKLTLTALLLGMNVIMSSSILSVPVPGGHMYLNDVIIVMAALMLEPFGAFAVGGLGAFLGDLIFYPTPMFVSLVTHGLQAALISFFVRRVLKTKPLPSAAIGAFLALKLCGMEFTLIALIGIILLIGIVKKNAIMLIDFALADERAGLDPFNAIYRACLLRFRPIMMTTFAALLGALPLMLASGSGAELRTPMGVSIVGGLLLSQLLTLFTTPVIYLMFERLSGRYDGRTSPDMSLHPGAHAQEGER